MKRNLLGLAAALAVLGSVSAFAQIPAITTVPTINPSADLVQIVPNGQPTPNNQYTYPAILAGAPAYTDAGVGTTGGSYTFKHGQTNYFMRPSGTLAAVTVITEATPDDGQRECFLSTQTTSSLTWTANTGQTVTNGPSAGVANTPICMTYESAAATWFRSP